MPKYAIFMALLTVLIPCSIQSAAFAADYRREGTLIGRQTIRLVRTDESLLEIARQYDLGGREITAANPGVDPFVPRVGRRIVVPTEWILPDVPIRKGIVVNIAEMRLFVYPRDGSEFVSTYPIGIGDQGTDTPVGSFLIIEKIENPAWNVPKSIRSEHPDLPAVVPPGPNNPMGSHALRLSDPTVLIHGTNRPWGIGNRDSHGCIRLYPEDIVRLFRTVRRGTPVTIVNQPVLTAVRGDRVYMAVHDYGDGRNLYFEALKVLEAKGLTSRVNLKMVRKAGRERTGLLVDISK